MNEAWYFGRPMHDSDFALVDQNGICSMNDDPSHFGFDDDRSLAAKLGRTFLLLLIAGFLIMFTALVFGFNGNLWWQIPAEIALEVCWTFWLLANVVNWYTPPWLHSLFRHAEKRMVWLMSMLKWLLGIIFVIFFVAGILLLLGVFAPRILGIR